METVLDQLGQLVVKALPTFFLVLVLHWYLKLVLYRPLDRVLEARRQATDGARQEAHQYLRLAEERASEYERRIQAIRDELASEAEQMRRRWRQQQAEALMEARRKADATIREAKRAIQQDLEAARLGLEAEADALAETIVELVLRRAS